MTETEYSGNGTAGREADVKPTGFFFQMPQREWQGLTAKDLAEIPPSCYEGAIWADAKLREKNV